ncbi:MAG: hypothetical protein WCX73_03730 [Candidatus Pacearchaeota archaeon]
MSFVNLEKKGLIEGAGFDVPYYPYGFVMPEYIKEKWKLEHADKNSVNKTVPILQFDFFLGGLKPLDQFNAIVMPREAKEKRRRRGGRGPHRIFQFRFSHNYIGHIIKTNRIPERNGFEYDNRIKTLPHKYIQSGLVYRFEVLAPPRFLPDDNYRNYKIFFCRPLSIVFGKNGLENKLTHVNFRSGR